MENESKIKAFIGSYNGERSRTALRYIINNHNPDKLCIITTADRRDSGFWKEVLTTVDCDIDATVDSWQRIRHHEDKENCFFIFDGDEVYGSGVHAKSFLKIARKNSCVVACEENDTWLDYAALFIACGFYKNRTEFLRDHAVFDPYTRYPKIKHYVNVERLKSNLDSIRVKLPFEQGMSDA